MPIPATNIKTISKIDSFRFIKFSFSACFCSVIIILYFTIYRNCVPQSQFVKIVCAIPKHIPSERNIVVVGKFPYGEPPSPVREESLYNAKAYHTRVLHCGGLHEPVGAFIGRPP